MSEYPDQYTLLLSGKEPEPTKDDIVRILKESGAEVAPELSAGRLGRGHAVLCRMCPWRPARPLSTISRCLLPAIRYGRSGLEEKNLPLIGDDIKAQLGATITHRMLTDLFKKRGVKLERTYQLNTGGNTDFLNMLNHSRLVSKKESKTEAVQSVAAQRLDHENIHIGPSDYVAWQKG